MMMMMHKVHKQDKNKIVSTQFQCASINGVTHDQSVQRKGPELNLFLTSVTKYQNVVISNKSIVQHRPGNCKLSNSMQTVTNSLQKERKSLPKIADGSSENILEENCSTLYMNLFSAYPTVSFDIQYTANRQYPV